MLPPRKRAASVGLEKQEKYQRQSTAHERNTDVAAYLDTLVVGTAPEQQISFDRIATMIRPGDLYVDNDEDDDISNYERDRCAVESIEVMNNLSTFMTPMLEKLKAKRAAPPLATVIPPEAFPQQQRTFNPFWSSPVERLQALMSPEEERILQSCSLAASLPAMTAVWKDVPFSQLSHFRNTAKQIFPIAALRSDLMLMHSDTACAMAWTCSDEEALISAAPKVWILFLLAKKIPTNQWYLDTSMIVPLDVFITLG